MLYTSQPATITPLEATGNGIDVYYDKADCRTEDDVSEK
jgi:hypothetical protein